MKPMPKDTPKKIVVDRAELLSVLRGCRTAINLGFNAEGDVYGIQHNAMTDLSGEVERWISELEKMNPKP